MNIFKIVLLTISVLIWFDGEAASTSSGSNYVDTPAKMITVEAFDADSRDNLQSFVLDFSSCGFKVYESDEDGRFSMNAPDSFACYVQISKPGYARTDILIDVNDVVSDQKTFKVYLAKSSNLHMVQVRDALKKNRYIQEAKIRFKSLLDDNVQEIESGQGGKFEVLCQPQHRYVLEVKHPRYATYRGIVEADEEGQFDLGDVFLQPVNHPQNDQSRWTSGKIVDHRTGDKSIPHFSLQIGATSNPLYDLTSHQEDLTSFGKVYLQEHNNIYRIKVGRFYTRKEAEAALEKLKKVAGFKDAYVTQTITEKTPEMTPKAENVKSPEIMVRLASYQNPAFFDQASVAHLGQIDLLPKEEWKIAVIRGFSNVEEAELARKAAQEVGFAQAHLVEYMDDAMVKMVPQ